MATPSLLLVDDSTEFCMSLKRALSGAFSVAAVHSPEEAAEIPSPPPDLILLDLRLRPGSDDTTESLKLLQRFRQVLPDTPVLVITAYGDVDKAVECIRLGAADFMEKDKGLRELRARLARALEHARLTSRVRQLEEELAIVEPRQLVGESAAIGEVKGMIAAVARDAAVTVLITGETGTGKELVARAIHATGPRAQSAFVPVAIAALPPSMVEAELFGYEAGAFTDAKRRHIGFIERAQGGVLFLDEIGELPLATQVRLLRFLEERTVARLGAREEVAVDCQVVAATNADLGGAIRQGQFREDLYYRLKVCEIRIPPLRERRTDIPLLVDHFFAKVGGRRKSGASLSPLAAEALAQYAWPGNVRELRNAIESALLRSALRRHSQIEADDLPEELRRTGPINGQAAAREARHQTDPGGLNEALARLELEQVERALRAVEGRKSDAWRLLGLNDRFALRRRVLRIFRDHLDLAALFPAVAHAFPPVRKRRYSAIIVPNGKASGPKSGGERE